MAPVARQLVDDILLVRALVILVQPKLPVEPAVECTLAGKRIPRNRIHVVRRYVRQHALA